MEPIITLYERASAVENTLPKSLAELYGGGLYIPQGQADSLPYVIANFVETMDGVVSYNAPGLSGGGMISGDNAQDQMVMGILRAYADAVIFGSGSLSQDANHIHTPAGIFPALANAYEQLRGQLHKKEHAPMSVIMSSSGCINLEDATFHTPGLRALVITTPQGYEYLRCCTVPQGTEIRVIEPANSMQTRVELRAALALLACEYGVRVALYEGGPTLFASFLAGNLVNELFLTLSPQIVGRLPSLQRLGLVEDRAFGPQEARWSTLLSAKMAGSHLLLRYLLRTSSLE